MAATVRVGQAVGRDDAGGVRRAGFAAALLGLALGSVDRRRRGRSLRDRAAIPREHRGTIDATVALAATLLLVGATFFIADALQAILAGALRGMKDTRMPLLFAAIGYWTIGFPAAWVLAFHAELGAPGVWIGLSIGTSSMPAC